MLAAGSIPSIKRVAIFVAAAFLMVAGSLVNAPQLHYMSSLLLSLPLISYLVGRYSVRGLCATRGEQPAVWAGQAVTLTLEIRSSARSPHTLVEVHEKLPDWLAPLDEAPIVAVRPGETARAERRVDALRRGAHRVGGVELVTFDPLGLFAFRQSLRPAAVAANGGDDELIVYPVPEALPAAVFGGAERFGFRETPASGARGSGVDPDGVRDYQPGDPVNRMHWKTVARTGRLTVMEFEEPRTGNLVMALDLTERTDVGTGAQSTLEYLVRLAASLAEVAVRQGASVRLLTGDPEDPANQAGRGTAHMFTILTALARAQSDQRESFSATLPGRLGAIAPGATVAVLTAFADPQLAPALGELTRTGAQAQVYFADPSTFAVGLRRSDVDDLDSFLAGLLAARVTPYVLRRSEDGALHPEAPTGARGGRRVVG